MDGQSLTSVLSITLMYYGTRTVSGLFCMDKRFVDSEYKNYEQSKTYQILYHLVGRRIMSFGRTSKIYHLIGRRKMSFEQSCEVYHLVKLRKYVIWSGVEICRLVGLQIRSFDWVSENTISLGIEIYHFIGHPNM